MARNRPPRTPKYRHHKASGQGFVELDRHRFYLGKYALPETQEAYHRMIAEWIANGRSLPVDQDQITMVEVIARFLDYAIARYRLEDDSGPSEEYHNFRRALKPVKELYGSTEAVEFGPRALKAIRKQFIGKGNCRTGINSQVGRIKSVFRWAVEEELIPASVYHAVKAVRALEYGHTDAPESEDVVPVPQDQIDAVKPFLCRQVWAMIQLELLTASRPGEVTRLRAIDLDTSGDVWTYRPKQHKNRHRGHAKTIFLGPRAQEIVKEFMVDRPVVAFLFSPREAESERLAARHAARKTPLKYGNRPGTNRRKSPSWEPGERYTTDSYRKAIYRACKQACIETWSPNQLRHSAGTHVRQEFGVEAAQLIMGHKHLKTTEIYAEADRAKGLEIAAKIG